LDLLFERGVSARKFASTDVDVFEDEVILDGDVVGRYEEKLDASARHDEQARTSVF
jgi:SP family general alpha glucoside:H+ symporter-like MFS transporter